MTEKEIKVVYKLDYSNPIKVSDFANSLASFDKQYARFVQRNKLSLTDSHIRFYIKEINKGSIEAVMVPVFSYLLAFPDDTMSVFEYVTSLKEMFGFLMGRNPSAPYHFDKADLKHAKNMARPIANDSASQLNILATDNAQVKVELNVTPADADAIIQGANSHQRLLEQPDLKYLPGQALYFRSTEDTFEESKLTRGIIHSITDEPIPVSSPYPEIINQILENPYRRGFDVDVVVSFIEGQPVQYSIQKMNKTLERSDNG